MINMNHDYRGNHNYRWWWWEGRGGGNEHDCRADQWWWSLHRHDNRWLMKIISQTALLRYLRTRHSHHPLHNATHSFSSSPPNHIIIIIIIIHSLIHQSRHSFIHSFIHSMMMIMMKWEITNCAAISFVVIVIVGGVGMWRLISEMNIKLAFIDQISDHFFSVIWCRHTHRWPSNPLLHRLIGWLIHNNNNHHQSLSLFHFSSSINEYLSLFHYMLSLIWMNEFTNGGLFLDWDEMMIGGNNSNEENMKLIMRMMVMKMMMVEILMITRSRKRGSDRNSNSSRSIIRICGVQK